MKKISVTGIRQLFLFLIIPVVVLFVISTAHAGNICSQKPDSSSIAGRWDITIYIAEKMFPSWLEVTHSGFNTLVGQFVGIVGSSRPISQVYFSNGKISFSIPPQWEAGNNLSFEATLRSDSLIGVIIFPDGKNYNCTAVRAPSLRRQAVPVWGSPIHIFNGNDLKGWHASGENQWKAENGILKSQKLGSNLITDANFTDFKLHIEFRYAKNGNSGVYLRGRYEIQIVEDNESEPQKGVLGAVYGFLPPSEMVAKKAGDWQSYDITLAGRMVTVTANGKTIICNQEIPGITGGALNSKEAEPGPIMLQGDHEPIEYRNIKITPAK
jgi:Domain of Unknown Function (DUF1080)